MSDPTALYEERAELLKALAYPLRLRVVHGLLKCGCHNVGRTEANTGQSQSCTSQYLVRLKVAGVVETARSGNEIYYEIANPEVAAVLSILFGGREEEYQCTISR